MKHVLITGGAGFIGSHVAELCLLRGHKVTIVDDLSVGLESNVPKGAELLVGDFRTVNVDEIVRSRKVSDVCHLAAKVSVRSSKDTFIDDANVNFIGTLRLIKSALGHKLSSFIFASSMAVYGDSQTIMPQTEDFTTEPRSPYGVSKLAAERDLFILMAGGECRPVALRYFNVFGPRQRVSSYVGVITIFSDLLRKKKTIQIFGDGSQQRDFVSVHDVSAATVSALENSRARGPFNIGSGTATSINRLADMMIEIFGASPTLKTFAPKNNVELTHAVADITRAIKELQYAPKHDLQSYLCSLAK
jgi:UDP-glucose 4-epimerase